MSTAQVSTAPLRMAEAEFLRRYADLSPAYEFVNGEVTQKPMVKLPHLQIVEELIVRLGVWRRQSGLRASSGPEPTVNLSRGADRRYRAPDVAYWGPGKPRNEGDIFLPPTLAVEVQSPGQTLMHLRAKCREYRERGVDVAWLVLPSRRVVEVFDDERDGAALSGHESLVTGYLPGFELGVDELFTALDS
ncbi:MAG: hypothetical protein C0506_01855 [Anaerolinea sp.]|nr:hypothetical protein [Anaerolinea sp.]